MATANPPQVPRGTAVTANDIVFRIEQLDSAGNIVGSSVTSALPTGTNSIGNVGHNVTTIGDGNKTVTTAGTRVTLAASTAAKYVTITASAANTGTIVVGGTTVVAAAGTRRGTALLAGDTVTLPVDDLNDVNLDSTVNGEGVAFTYVN